MLVLSVGHQKSFSMACFVRRVPGVALQSLNREISKSPPSKLIVFQDNKLGKVMVPAVAIMKERVFFCQVLEIMMVFLLLGH